MQYLEYLIITVIFEYPFRDHDPHHTGRAFGEIINTHFQALISHDLLWEATRIFTIHCGATQKRYSYVAEQHYKLMSALGGIELLSSSEALPNDKNKLLCALAATEALMKYYDRCASPGFQPTDRNRFQLRLLREIRSSTVIEKLFEELRLPLLRGNRVSFWKNAETRLARLTLNSDFEELSIKDEIQPFQIKSQKEYRDSRSRRGYSYLVESLKTLKS